MLKTNRQYTSDNECRECGTIYEEKEKVEDCEFCSRWEEVMSVPKQKTYGPYR